MTGIIFKLTTAGRAALVNAAHDGTNARRVVSVGITATAFTPSEALAAIPGEIKRITTIAGDVVASDTIHVTIRDDGADSYTVRGLGLYLDNGVLLGTYSQAAVILEKSPVSIFLLATDVRVLDGSVDISTLQFGETNFINPPATTERQGVVQLATKAIAEALTDATRSLTAASVAGLFAARALVTRKISTGDGLEGGGNLESDRTLSVKFGTAADTVAMGNHTHSAVTQTANGLMIAADKKKLDGIEESANNYALPAATSVALGGVKLGHATVQEVAASNPTATDARTYPVQVNSAGQAVVNVPWTNTNTTYGAVTQTVNGLMIAADKKKLDGIEESANNYALPAATSAALGGVKLGHATVQTVAASNPTSTDARTYPVQASSDGQLVVNVPWDNTNTTYGAVTPTANGLMIAADKKKLDGIEENANNYTLPAATDEVLGGAKLATVDLAIAGVSKDTVVTPEGLKAAMRLNGLPIFFNGHHDGDRASLIRVFNGMATPDDGDQLSALTHPGIVLGILRGDVKSCTDAEWLVDPYKRGMWSKGNAYLDEQGKPQGWVRMSDRNGVKEGSLPPPFWRGSGQGDAAIGSIAKDTMRNLTWRIANLSRGDTGHIDALAIVSGALKLTPSGVSKSTIQNSTSSYPTAFLDFDASLGLPPGHTTDPVTGEFRPWSINGLSYTITANGIVNEAALDAAGVMAQVLLLQGRVTALEGWDLGVSTQKWVTTTTTRLQGVSYVADQSFKLRVEVNVGSVTAGSVLVTYTIDGEAFTGATQPYGAGAVFVSEMLIPKGCKFSYQPSGSLNASTLKVREFRRGA